MYKETFWLNTEEDGYLSTIAHRSREDADLHAALMYDDHGRKRTACLKLVVSWEDGQGLDSPAMELSHAQD